MDNVTLYQWVLVAASSILLFIISPWARTTATFFGGRSDSDASPNFWLLSSSLIISWIFAKSITNAANLGLAFGAVGGAAYAAYYLSFIVAGIVIYRIRVHGGFGSIHEMLNTYHGRAAVQAFSLVIGIRLFNEVWSNTAVIGSYFGPSGSPEFIAAVVVFTLLTLAYSLKGGMRSSIVTDMIQMLLFGVLLFIILAMILPRQESVGRFLTSGVWSMETGLNLFFVALLQIFSYPFHDPVMTDRGFLSSPRTTLKAFIVAGVVGALCIFLFSFIGIYAQLNNLEGQAPVVVGQTLGVGMMLLMNFIMISSAASTLDSTFASSAKLFLIDLAQKAGLQGEGIVNKGRIVMLLTAVAGSTPLFFSPEIISATTVSGTMVIGLAPVFVFWRLAAPPLSFHLSFWTGIAVGLCLVFGWIPEGIWLTSGKYADLLTANVYGTILCFILFFVPVVMRGAAPAKAQAA